jgi:hypothetical protein
MVVPKISSISLFFVKRKRILLSLCIVTPLGFLFKSYSGPAHRWFNDYGAGVLYEVFWCLVVFFFVPKKKYTIHIAAGVFAITSILEILQLWHPQFLQQARATFLGAALLGTTFVWWDFFYYILGCVLGWLCMRTLSKGFKSTDLQHSPAIK